MGHALHKEGNCKTVHTPQGHRSGFLNYFSYGPQRAKDSLKIWCLRAKWSPLCYVFLCILELTKGKTSMACGLDLAHVPPFEKACHRWTLSCTSTKLPATSPKANPQISSSSLHRTTEQTRLLQVFLSLLDHCLKSLHNTVKHMNLSTVE